MSACRSEKASTRSGFEGFDLVGPRVQERRDARLAARFGWAHRVTRHADHAIALAEQVEDLGRFLGQAHDARRVGHARDCTGTQLARMACAVGRRDSQHAGHAARTNSQSQRAPRGMGRQSVRRPLSGRTLMLVRTAITRRSLLAGLGVGAALLWPRGVYADALTETARTTEGPFYPDQLPLDTDNDLLLLNDALTPSTGRITYFSGRILSLTGAPVRNAIVEIWQCDAKGSYLHSKGRVAERDPNFQGYGRCPHRLDRRVRLPHHPAGLVFAVRHHPRTAHPPRDQSQRAACADHPGACRGRPAQCRRRRAHEARPSGTCDGHRRLPADSRQPAWRVRRALGRRARPAPPSKVTMASRVARSANRKARPRSGTTSRPGRRSRRNLENAERRTPNAE